MEIKTERLIIRKIESTGDLSVVNAMECPEIHLMHSNGFTNVEKVQSYIAVLTKEYESGNFRTLAIAKRSQMSLEVTLDGVLF